VEPKGDAVSCTGGYFTGLALGLPTGIVAGLMILFAVAFVWVMGRLFR
jgi:hypothetical protein